MHHPLYADLAARRRRSKFSFSFLERRIKKNYSFLLCSTRALKCSQGVRKESSLKKDVKTSLLSYMTEIRSPWHLGEVPHISSVGLDIPLRNMHHKMSVPPPLINHATCSNSYTHLQCPSC
jgi:hypothetical protein